MQQTLSASVIRGGTSRGVFLRLHDLPPDDAERDAILLQLLGSPDPIQVDGLGGGHSHTSKAMAVGPSDEDDVDVDYLFAQVDVRQPVVDYGGNCGNLTAAVAVYAVEEGLVEPPQGDLATVVLRCLNTGTKVRVSLPVDEGHAKVEGDYAMAGIPHTGAEIRVEYLEPAGAMLGRGALPMGAPITSLDGAGGIEVSIVDVTSPLIIVKAADLGLKPPFVPENLNTDANLLSAIERIRGESAVQLGMVERADDAVRLSPSQPKVALCVGSVDYETTIGTTVRASEVDIVATMSSVQRIHHAFAGTGAMCLAAACRLPGTIAADLATRRSSEVVRVGHPKGVAEASVTIDPSGEGVEAVGVSRTARVIMRGEVYYRPMEGNGLAGL